MFRKAKAGKAPSPKRRRKSMGAIESDLNQAERELQEMTAELQAEVRELERKIAEEMGRLRLDHLFIGTADFAGAWRFWTEVVGLKGQAKWGNPEYGGTVEMSGSTITIAQGEEGPYDELGYVVENGRPQLYLHTPDVDKLHGEIAARGGKVLRAPVTTHFGARCFSIEGPDGMVVVFTQAKQE